MTSGTIVVRNAKAEDYSAFAQLFNELAVPDRTPALSVWRERIVSTTKVACIGRAVVGYCYFQEYAEGAYVRQIAVAADRRRRGVARTMMKAVGEHLRARGKKTWRLNVKPENEPAIALYTAFGLRVLYTSKALRLPWSALPKLSETALSAVPLERQSEADLEELFSLQRGQLGVARAQGSVLIAVTALDGQKAIGVGAFDPKFPGASPFRLEEPSGVRALLERMYEHATEKEYVDLLIEDNAPLAALLESAGATVNLELVHMHGWLPGEAAQRMV